MNRQLKVKNHYFSPCMCVSSLCLVCVEQGEVVVVRDLLPGQDVPLRVHRHPVQTVHVPLLHLTVRVTRVVNEPKNMVKVEKRSSTKICNSF